MNILQLSQTTIYPPKSGGEHRTHGLVTSFPDLGHTVQRYCVGGLFSNHSFPEIESKIQISRNYTEIRPICPLYDLPSIPASVLEVPGTWTGPILKVFPQQELINQIEEADVILAEGPHLVRPAVQLSENSVILYSSHNVEIDRWSHLQNTYLKDRYYNSLKKSESFAVSESDGVICVSEQDLQRFSEIYGSVSNPVIVPNGTYESNIHNNVDRSSSNVRKDLGIDLDQTVALFVGSDYGPNVDAARKIVTWSEQACDENQDIHFLLVGNVGNRIDADNNHLTVTGFVDNIEPMYACADIALNPITDGAGSNIKIIDYLARGLPVISTPFGVRGFEFEENTIIINEIESIYNRVKEYGSGSKQIQQRKIQTVASKYTWHTLSKKLLSYLGENFNAE